MVIYEGVALLVHKALRPVLSLWKFVDWESKPFPTCQRMTLWSNSFLPIQKYKSDLFQQAHAAIHNVGFRPTFLSTLLTSSRTYQWTTTQDGWNSNHCGVMGADDKPAITGVSYRIFMGWSSLALVGRLGDVGLGGTAVKGTV